MNRSSQQIIIQHHDIQLILNQGVTCLSCQQQHAHLCLKHQGTGRVESHCRACFEHQYLVFFSHESVLLEHYQREILTFRNQLHLVHILSNNTGVKQEVVSNTQRELYTHSAFIVKRQHVYDLELELNGVASSSTLIARHNISLFSARIHLTQMYYQSVPPNWSKTVQTQCDLWSSIVWQSQPLCVLHGQVFGNHPCPVFYLTLCMTLLPEVRVVISSLNRSNIFQDMSPAGLTQIQHVLQHLIHTVQNATFNYTQQPLITTPTAPLNDQEFQRCFTDNDKTMADTFSFLQSPFMPEQFEISPPQQQQQSYSIFPSNTESWFNPVMINNNTADMFYSNIHSTTTTTTAAMVVPTSNDVQVEPQRKRRRHHHRRHKTTTTTEPAVPVSNKPVASRKGVQGGNARGTTKLVENILINHTTLPLESLTFGAEPPLPPGTFTHSVGLFTYAFKNELQPPTTTTTTKNHVK